MTISSDTLQLVAYINIFVVGVVATIVIQRVFKRIFPHEDTKQDAKQERDKDPLATGTTGAETTPFGNLDIEPHNDSQPAYQKQQEKIDAKSDELFVDRHKLLEESQQEFEAVLQESATKLRDGLTTTTDQLNKQLHSLGNDIIKTEITRYHQELQKLREQTEQDLTGAQAGIDKHQAELQAKLDEQHAMLSAKLNEDMVAEKKRLQDELAASQQKLLSQIDNKMGEAVTSFLLETLQHEVDLGAQTTYLTRMLEEHKEELKQEMGVANIEVAKAAEVQDKAK